MKRMAIVFLSLTLLCTLLLSVGCGTLDQDPPQDTSLTVETDPPAAEITTADTQSIQVSIDYGVVASRGLSFTSNGDGTCTLSGIGNCIDTCLIIPHTSDSGDKVVAVAPQAFAGNTAICAVQIPTSITSIGNAAFAGCPSLSYISVSQGNSAYCDIGGILYSADMATLICIPAGTNMTSITLTMQVKTIAPRASEGCTKISTLLFEGDEAQWKKIIIGEGNNVLTTIKPTFMKQAGK